MTSPKNILQEHYQRLKLPLPIYISSIVGGEAHRPQWTSQVKLPTGEVFSVPPMISKIAAENDAATVAIYHLGIHADIERSQPKPNPIHVELPRVYPIKKIIKRDDVAVL